MADGLRRPGRAPSTWSPATRRTSRSRPGSRSHPRPATTTRPSRCGPATTASTRCGWWRPGPPGCCGPTAGWAPSTPTSRASRRRRCFTGTGRWTDVRDHRDLAGRPRFVTARLARMSPREHALPDRRPPSETRPRGQGRQPGRPARGAGGAADRHGLRPRRRCVRPRRGQGAARGQGAGPGHAAAGAGQRRHDAGRARDRHPRVRPGAGRRVLAGPADPGLHPAAVAAVGPRRHPRHGRGADARPRGGARAARAHRAARRQLAPTSPAGRRPPTPSRPRRCSARAWT